MVYTTVYTSYREDNIKSLIEYMSYTARVFNVMIASPGDVQEERAAAFEIILKWNDPNSIKEQTVLLPIGWEHGSAPITQKTGGVILEPQEVINIQVLERSDLLVAIFWTRLGTRTKNATSGTVEEIERHIASGKPAMIYFSDSQINPSKIDPQYKEVQNFKKLCQKKKYFYGSFNSLEQFKQLFTQHLDLVLNWPFFAEEIERGINRKANAEKLATVRNNLEGIGNNEGSTQAVSDNVVQRARAILLAASEDSDGTIITSRILAGFLVETNNINFIQDKSPREESVVSDAISYLINRKFIVELGASKFTVTYKITTKGFEYADKLKPANSQKGIKRFAKKWHLDIRSKDGKSFSEDLEITEDGSYFVYNKNGEAELCFQLKIVKETGSHLIWQKLQFTPGNPEHSVEHLACMNNVLRGNDTYGNKLVYTGAPQEADE